MIKKKNMNKKQKEHSSTKWTFHKSDDELLLEGRNSALFADRIHPEDQQGDGEWKDEPIWKNQTTKSKNRQRIHQKIPTSYTPIHFLPDHPLW